MVLDTWKVYWREYSSDTYLYGSDIVFHDKKNVEYTNELMPPGTIIKEWYSRTDFQRQMIEPTLPLIDGESAYRIILDADHAEDEQCLLRVVFYDRYENEAGNITIRDKEAVFRCPMKTYSYRVQLINGGLTHFVFHEIVIQEVTLDEMEQ